MPKPAQDNLTRDAEEAEGEVSPSADASPSVPRTVTVHCSLPAGIILSLDKDIVLPVSEGGDGYKIHVPQRRVKISGGPNFGIDADFWRAWLLENGGYSAVLSGHIFAVEDPV